MIDPKSLARYGVSGSQGFARLTATVFDPLLLKVRVKKPKMRRTLGYFAQHKFGTAAVGDRIKDLGFEPGIYEGCRELGWTDEAKAAADAEHFELWDFRELMRQIADSIRDRRSYFTEYAAHHQLVCT